MNFTQELMSVISDRHLLNHEFYKSWNEGSIPVEVLQYYARQYYQHVKAFPRYLSATHSNCDDIRSRQVLLDNLIDEEKGAENHPELWLRFAEGLGSPRKDVEAEVAAHETQDLIDTFMAFSKSSYAEGLGALFAYEHQVPEIAKFKIEALEKHYDIKDASTLAFFDVHQKADVYHTQALSALLEDLSPEDKELSKKATQVTAEKLWKFLDGITKQMPC